MALTLAPSPPIAESKLAETPRVRSHRQSGVITRVTGALKEVEITITS